MIRQRKEKHKQVISEGKIHKSARSQKKPCWFSIAYHLQVILDWETFYFFEPHGSITLALTLCKFDLI